MTKHRIAASLVLAVSLTSAQDARADANGVSFWLRGTFGSLAAVPAPAGRLATFIITPAFRPAPTLPLRAR